MRHTTFSTTRPAAARGLGAVVLFALLALLHATFSPGPSHISGLDLDGCRLRAAVSNAHNCPPVATVVATGAGAEGHHGDDASQSCDASGYGPRQLADSSSSQAASGPTSGVLMHPSQDSASPTPAGASAHDSPSGSVVLRC